MREQPGPTALTALEVAEEVMPAPSGELAGLPLAVRVQCQLFDALVLVAAARKELAGEEGCALHWASADADAICDGLNRLIERFAS